MAARRSSRIKKLVRKVRPRLAKGSARAAWWTSPRVITGGVVALFAAAVLVGVYQGLNANGQRRADSRTARVDTPAAGETPIAPARSEAAVPAAPSEASAVDRAGDHASAGMTITGCLERSESAFRLTDTTGTRAPTSRTWKSAFLKRRAAPIEIVAAKPLNLTSHVGQRVSVTGTLVDREMRVGSLQRIASSCATQKAKAL